MGFGWRHQSSLAKHEASGADGALIPPDEEHEMTSSADFPPSHTQAAFYAAPFEVLDACHREILSMLEDLRALLDHVDKNGVDFKARTLARDIHLFFSTTGMSHHLDEEHHVFPGLLKHGDQETAATIELLRKDHVDIEAKWLALVPYLDMLARGYRHLGLAEVRALVDAFSSLCRRHIAQEEALVYPQVKARLNRQDLWIMRREMAARRGGLNLPPPDIGSDQNDSDLP
jgi:hemerythrin-like domain-containing protein